MHVAMKVRDHVGFCAAMDRNVTAPGQGFRSQVMLLPTATTCAFLPTLHTCVLNLGSVTG
jgi:hypothetical protein